MGKLRRVRRRRVAGARQPRRGRGGELADSGHEVACAGGGREDETAQDGRAARRDGYVLTAQEEAALRPRVRAVVEEELQTIRAGRRGQGASNASVRISTVRSA